MSVEAGPSKLRSPSLAMLEHAQLIKQGAEAVSRVSGPSVTILNSLRNLKPVSGD